jgi:hypothetical protein
MPPAELSPRQIVAGPNMPDVVSDRGHVVSIRTDHEFDVAELIAGLPEDQQPDLVVVLFDAFRFAVARNLEAVTCRRLLYLADTHHGFEPLSSAFAYIEREPFDRYALAHDPHHLHWFVERGIAPFSVQLNVSARDVIEPTFSPGRAPGIVFVGQASLVHTWRKNLLARLEADGLPVHRPVVPAHEAATLYDTHQLCLNTSNGDWTMRFFEVLSAGGCLLTDRISSATGCAEYFHDGRDVIYFDDADDLIDKARFHLARPELCLRIARNGHAVYRKHFAEHHRTQRFLEFAFATDDHAAAIAARHQTTDPRCAAAPPVGPMGLRTRVAAYEQLQELQRADLISHVHLSPGTPESVARDLSDLMRLAVTRNATEPATTCMIVQGSEVLDLFADATDVPRFLYLMDDNPPNVLVTALLRLRGYTTPTDLMTRHVGLFVHSPDTGAPTTPALPPP